MEELAERIAVALESIAKNLEEQTRLARMSVGLDPEDEEE
jgi:hypothetical protein